MRWSCEGIKRAKTEEREWTLESLLQATHKPDTVFGTIGYPSLISNMPVLVDGKWYYERDAIKINTYRDPISGKFIRIGINAHPAGFQDKCISLQREDYSSARQISDRDITDLGRELEKAGIRLSGKAYHYLRENQEQVNKTELFIVGP